jgi:hypothetical protein
MIRLRFSSLGYRHAATLLVLAATGVAMPAFADESAPQFSPADLDFYERKIRPLLVERCYKCHSAQAKVLKGGLRLDTSAGVKAGGDSGALFDPQQPEQSLLVEAVRYTSDIAQMPPQGKLAEREIALFAEWVRRGAPMPPDGATPGTREGIDFEAGRKFWSFQPLHRQALPKVRDTDWPRQRIDHFLLARLEAESLVPSSTADRRTLIRRATFDVLGLPPTAEEIDAFVADDRPDAYERLVDRLLASPQYGERWGRYWLDLARYTDTTDTWLSPLDNAWLYRDWVIAVLNDDLPYDEFVTRQLATDQMQKTGPEDIPALGYLGLSPTYWKEPRLAPDVIAVIVADEWEERIDAVGRGLLGLTLACARCHDHKFDPITSQDYYALAGVLASTRLVDRPIIPQEAAAMAAKAREVAAALEAKLGTLKLKRNPDEPNPDEPNPDEPNPDEPNPDEPNPDEPNPDEIVKAEMAEIAARIDALKQTPHFDSPLAHAVDDAALYVLPDGDEKTKLVYKPGEPRDLAVQIRGNPSNEGEVVPRRFLAVLSFDSPPPFTHGSGRIDLAEAIFHEGAPLAARVIVNRVWMHHFGRGLVDTPSDFGRQGSRPTHPELLDDLAARFAASGWSLKWLHRELLLSAAYRQASDHDERKFALDADNRLLWRMSRRRLDVEAWRDAMLAVVGTLDLKQAGPAQNLDDRANRRRTVYGRVDRRNLHDMLRLYDFPAPESHSPKRDPTTTPLQQLFVLNSEFLRRRAEELAGRARMESGDSLEEQIDGIYQLTFGRMPTERERLIASEFLSQSPAGWPRDELWTEYAHALLASNEFLYVD